METRKWNIRPHCPENNNRIWWLIPPTLYSSSFRVYSSHHNYRLSLVIFAKHRSYSPSPLTQPFGYRLSVGTRITFKRVNRLLLQYIHHTSFTQQEPGWFVLVQLMESEVRVRTYVVFSMCIFYLSVLNNLNTTMNFLSTVVGVWTRKPYEECSPYPTRGSRFGRPSESHNRYTSGQSFLLLLSWSSRHF